MHQDKVFTDIYIHNKWNGRKSRSGNGSDDIQTKMIAESLPRILCELSIKSMLDIPCGDLFWMRHVNLSNIKYIGADIVKPLIESNAINNESKEFVVLDIINDDLPSVDLIFCRDCLVHFDNVTVINTLKNLVRSKSKYVMMTTFMDRLNQYDITMGQWRPLNLRAKPFYLPQPIININERCTEFDGEYGDKCMSVWSVESIAHSCQQY